MSEQNQELMRRAVEEVWNRGHFDAISEFVASDFVLHAPQGDIHGPAGVEQFFATLRAAFPDVHFEVEDQLADGDRVTTRWTASGTHKGTFQGIPPTGRRVKMAGTDIDRFANGKVVECWTNADDLGLLRQLGATPAPGRVGRAAGEDELSDQPGSGGR